ncbi:MAG TPA: hypothetical protein VKZ98_12125 [Aquaticitalea sp.]|nr:hypothetical protein [Aquaticitalea sp.]
MKNFQTLLFISVLNFSMTAQTTIEDVAGFYEVTYDANNALIIDKLILNADGTFVFHEYDKHDLGIPPERNKYAKGTWKLEKNLILFTSGENDLDEKHTLNFNKSKARFISKPSRDTSSRDIKTSIRFIQSEIAWITGRTLLKSNP